MVKFTGVLERYDLNGEKTGWTYIVVAVEIAMQLKKANRKIFKVKGKLDMLPVEGLTMFPVGGGKFILPLKAELRKKLGKKLGDSVQLSLTEDAKIYQIHGDLLECLADEPAALENFNLLTSSHQRYFSKWIESAKTEPTRVKRIAKAVAALAKGWGFPEMLRAASSEQSED